MFGIIPNYMYTIVSEQPGTKKGNLFGENSAGNVITHVVQDIMRSSGQLEHEKNGYGLSIPDM